MFLISTEVKYTHIYKKAAIFFKETKYMTFINISNTHFKVFTCGHGHTCIYVDWFQS